MAKKYKLIKEYPGSPKVGYISKPKINNAINSHYWMGRWFNPAEYPELWEEVVERNWEILSLSGILNIETVRVKGPNDLYYHLDSDPLTLEYLLSDVGGYRIHSVKRLSDGEVFTIGDRVINPAGLSFTISEFY